METIKHTIFCSGGREDEGNKIHIGLQHTTLRLNRSIRQRVTREEGREREGREEGESKSGREESRGEERRGEWDGK